MKNISSDIICYYLSVRFIQKDKKMTPKIESRNYVEKVIEGVVSIEELKGYFHTSVEYLENVTDTLLDSMNLCKNMIEFIDQNENREQMKAILVNLINFRGRSGFHYNTLRDFIKKYKQNIRLLKTNKIKDLDSLALVLAADYEMLNITCYFLAKQNELFTNIETIFQKSKFNENDKDHVKFLEMQKKLKEKQRQISAKKKLFEFRI